MSDEITKDWELYEKGVAYNKRLGFYETVNLCVDFFIGNQWRNSGDTHEMEKPVFNIIKRIITFFVASVTSSSTAIQFEPLAFSGDQENTDGLKAAEIAGAEVENLFEKFSMDNRRRDAAFQAMIKGDVAAHYWFDPTKKPYRGALGEDVQGEIERELVSGSNVFYGNANSTDKESQPYIIVSGRDMVENLKEEAEIYKNKDAQITADTDYEDEIGEGGQIEVDADDYGKAQYIIIYRRNKKTGTIKVSKSVKNAYIYKDIDTGLNVYPVAMLHWEKQENQYHGRPLAINVVPNQIFINKMFAMVMYNLMMTAFPKAVYNADAVENWSNEIGQAIPVHGLGQDLNINNVAGYLSGASMSDQITKAIEMAMSYTKETLGISDVAMGNVNPTNTSAIIAVQKSTVIPLENFRANMHECDEEEGKILLDMMGTYYGLRPIVITREGKKGTEMFDFSVFKDLWLQTRVDVGEASYWSELASIQTLDNLLQAGLIELIDYLERMPDGYIPQRQELINKLKAPAEQGQQQGAQQEEMYEQMAQFVESLPTDIQAQLQQLPPEQMEQQVMQMMQQGVA